MKKRAEATQNNRDALEHAKKAILEAMQAFIKNICGFMFTIMIIRSDAAKIQWS